MFDKIEKKKYIIIGIAAIVAILIIVKILDLNYQNKNTEDTPTLNIISEETEENLEEDDGKIVVYITGEVAQEGVIELDYGSRISDAIDKAGGLTDAANIKKVNLAYELEDGQKIYIPNLNEPEETEIIDDGTEGIEENTEETDEIVNINKADPEELQSLNGIGETLSKNIVEYRNQNGKFSKIEDLMNVPGIGEAKFNNIKNNIKVK